MRARLYSDLTIRDDHAPRDGGSVGPMHGLLDGEVELGVDCGSLGGATKLSNPFSGEEVGHGDRVRRQLRRDGPLASMR